MTEQSPDPVTTAATWIVGAFAGLGSLLLAGTQLAGFDWDKARHPTLAVVAMVTAVSVAATVVILATRVLTPSETLFSMVAREDRATSRAQRKGSEPAPTWEMAAEQDWLLRRLLVHDLLDVRPTDLKNKIRLGDTSAQESALKMVAAANRWRARRSFTQLRWTTLTSSLVVLICAISWSAFSTKSPDRPSAQTPVPVTVTLVATTDPATIIGPGCSSRELSGVAISGDLRSRPLVAFPAQSDCPETLRVITSNVGLVVASK
jgi:hypothetical protein